MQWLRTNHNFLSSIGGYGGPSPRPSADQFRRIFDSLYRLEDLASQIDRLVREISGHVDFGRMRRESISYPYIPKTDAEEYHQRYLEKRGLSSCSI